jgi:hypothetical protein
MSDQLQPDCRGLSEQMPTARLDKPSLRAPFTPPNLLADPDPTPAAARVLAFVALAAYLVSFVLPMSYDNEWFGGLTAFLLTAWLFVMSFWSLDALREQHFWLGIVPWLANPLFWKAYLEMFGRRTNRLVLGGVMALAAALVASGYLLASAFSPLLGSPLKIESFSQAYILGPAYYVWLGSYVLLAAAGFIGALLRRKTPTSRLPRDEF